MLEGATVIEVDSQVTLHQILGIALDEYLHNITKILMNFTM